MKYLEKKKLAFMSIVNNVKGFIRTASGVPPLTLPNCVDESSLVSYTITGVGVGDYDEAAGKYKIPVVCKGKNLVKDATYFSNVTTQYSTVIKGAVSLKANVSYTISFDTTKTGIQLQFTHWQNTKEGYQVLNCNGNRSRITITPKSNISFGSSDAIIQRSTATSTTAVGLCDNLMIEEGSTVTDFEPYVAPTTTNIYIDNPLSQGETIKNPVKLPTVKGTTIYTVGTTTQPSNMSAIYYATSKE